MTMNIQPSEIRVLEDHEIDLIVGGGLKEAAIVAGVEVLTINALPFAAGLAAVNGVLAFAHLA